MIWNGPGRLWTTPLSPGPFHCEKSGLPCATELAPPAAVARCGQPTLADRLALLIEHDAQVRERIAALQAEQAHLQEKINWCRGQIGDDER
jgi:hypothetical protein